MFVVLAPRQLGALKAARCRGGLEVVSPGGGGASSVAVAASRGSQERTGSVVVFGELDQAYLIVSVHRKLRARSRWILVSRK